MGPREEDNSLLLLSAVTLISGLIAFLPGLLEPTPALANSRPESVAHTAPVASNAVIPARVIVPFTPNTTPGER